MLDAAIQENPNVNITRLYELRHLFDSKLLKILKDRFSTKSFGSHDALVAINTLSKEGIDYYGFPDIDITNKLKNSFESSFGLSVGWVQYADFPKGTYLYVQKGYNREGSSLFLIEAEKIYTGILTYSKRSDDYFESDDLGILYVSPLEY